MFHSPDGLLHLTCCLLAAAALPDAAAGAGVDRLGVVLTGVTGGTVDILHDLDFEGCLNFAPFSRGTARHIFTHHIHRDAWCKSLKAFKKKWL